MGGVVVDAVDGEGSDVTVVTYGALVQRSLQAAAKAERAWRSDRSD